MAKKISELTAITTIADNDLTPIVDTSETETKKMTASQMKTYAQNGVVLTTDVIDNVTSTDTNKPLSANQGKTLNTRLTTVETNGIIGSTQYGGTLVTNFNTINKNGFYTGLGTATGVPNTSYSWFVTHQNSNTGTVSATQRAVAFSTNLIVYERNKISSTWGAWVNRSTVNNLTTASAGNGVLDAYQGKVLDDKITNLKTYSTSEIDTGKIWIDGKPIYRKVASFTTVQGSSYVTYDIGITNVNISQIISLEIVSDVGTPFSWFDKSSIDMYMSNKQLHFKPISQDFNNRTWYSTVEYTKTTD